MVKPLGSFSRGSSSIAAVMVNAHAHDGTVGALSTSSITAEVPSSNSSSLEVGATPAACSRVALASPYLRGIQCSGEVAFTGTTWASDLEMVAGVSSFAFEWIARLDSDPSNGAQGPVCLNFGTGGGTNEEPLSIVFDSSTGREIVVYANHFLGASEASVRLPAPAVGTIFHLIAAVDYVNETLTVWLDSDTAAGSPSFTNPAASADGNVEFAVMMADWGQWPCTHIDQRYYSRAPTASEVTGMFAAPWEVVGATPTDVEGEFDGELGFDGDLIGTITPGPAPISTADGSHLGVPGSGQSLSIGVPAVTAISTTQPFDSVDFSNVALVNSATEVPIVPLANFLRSERGSGVFVAGAFGLSGAALDDLNQGTIPFNTMMANIGAAVTAHGGLTVLGVDFIHGETDAANETPNYGAGLRTLQDQYDTAIKAETSQTRDVALLLCQLSSGTRQGSGSRYASLALEQFDAAMADDDLILVGPKYAIGTDGVNIYTADGTHLTNQGYLRLGELHALAWIETFVRNRPWRPLHAVSAEVNPGDSTQIVLEFYVPEMANGVGTGLVIDTTAVAPAWSTGPTTNGFYLDDSNPNPVHITGVVSVSGSTVTLQCSGPVQSGSFAEIGTRGLAGADGGNGFTTANHGSFRTNLRANAGELADYAEPMDSDVELASWACHQRIAVTGGVTPSASVAVVLDDRRWTWSYFAGSGAPSTPTGDWTPTHGGVTGVRQAGSATTGADTLGANYQGIGLAKSNNGVELSAASYLVAGSISDIPAGSDCLIRIAGNIQRPASTEYFLWKNLTASNNQVWIQAAANGNLSVRWGNSTQSLQLTRADALPATETLGLIDIYFRAKPVAEMIIVVNGVATSLTAVSGEGGLTTGDLRIFAAFNDSAGVNGMMIGLAGAVGLDAGWWSPEVSAADWQAMQAQLVSGEFDGDLAFDGEFIGGPTGFDPIVEGEFDGELDLGGVFYGEVTQPTQPQEIGYGYGGRGMIHNPHRILREVRAQCLQVTRDNGYPVTCRQVYDHFKGWDDIAKAGSQHTPLESWPAACVYAQPNQGGVTEGVGEYREETLQLVILVWSGTQNRASRAWEVRSLAAAILDRITKDPDRGGWAHNTSVLNPGDSSISAPPPDDEDRFDFVAIGLVCDYVPGLGSRRPMKHAEIYIDDTVTQTSQTLVADTWTPVRDAAWVVGDYVASAWNMDNAHAPRYLEDLPADMVAQAQLEIESVDAGRVSVQFFRNSTGESKSISGITVGAGDRFQVQAQAFLREVSKDEVLTVQVRHSAGGDITVHTANVIYALPGMQ